MHSECDIHLQCNPLSTLPTSNPHLRPHSPSPSLPTHSPISYSTCKLFNELTFPRQLSINTAALLPLAKGNSAAVLIDSCAFIIKLQLHLHLHFTYTRRANSSWRRSDVWLRSSIYQLNTEDLARDIWNWLELWTSCRPTSVWRLANSCSTNRAVGCCTPAFDREDDVSTYRSNAIQNWLRVMPRKRQCK